MMAAAIEFDSATHTFGLSRDLVASTVPERPDPPVPVDGVTIGIATMTENSPLRLNPPNSGRLRPVFARPAVSPCERPNFAPQGCAMKIGQICLATLSDSASGRFASLVEALARHDVEQHVLTIGVLRDA